MFKKLGTTALILGTAFLPFLSQVTVEGSSVMLESSEVSSLSSSLISGSSSLLNIIIGFVPILVAFVVIFFVMSFLNGQGVLKKWKFWNRLK